MPLVIDYSHVKELYAQAGELKVALPAFCAEDRETLEAILQSVYEYGQEIGVEDLPIVTAFTSRYPPRGQLRLVSSTGDIRTGFEMMLSDLEILTSPYGKYGKLRVMPHLDHGFPWLDGDVLLEYADRFASVMCDASEKPWDENIRLTAEYVDRVKGRVVVEGAVDEMFEADGAGEKNELTTPEQALVFLERTGVDLIVPNVGTEHRATVNKVVYNSAAAKEIQKAVGNIMCLHGSSSVDGGQIGQLPGDGFIKINIYTGIAVSGGKSLARSLLDNVGNIFTAEELQDLVDQGILGRSVLSDQYANTVMPIKPKLDFVANPPRRDAWVKGVVQKCKSYYECFNYSRFSQG